MIIAEKLIYREKFVTEPETSDTKVLRCRFLSGIIKLERLNQSDVAGTAKVHVTNFELHRYGEFDPSTDDSAPIIPAQVRFKIDDREFDIIAVDNYLDIQDILKATRGTDVTCTITTKVSSRTQFVDLMPQFDDLLDLLSLARSSHVVGVVYELISESGQVVWKMHRYQPVMSVGYQYVISPDDIEGLVSFIEASMPKYRKADQIWNMRQLIKMYTAAKSEEDSRELRALKLANCLEMIAKRACTNGEGIHIVDSKEFDQVLKLLEKNTKEILQTNFPNISSDQLSMMIGHLRGLNWRSFKRSLKWACETAKYGISNKDLQRIVSIRNHIVHYGTFDPEIGAEGMQYMLLEKFLTKLLLGFAGYSQETSTYWDTLRTITGQDHEFA